MTQQDPSEQIWSPPTRYTIVLVLMIGAVALIIYARELFAALTIAVLITYLLNPVVRILQLRLRIGQRIAATIVYAAFLLLLTAGLITSTPLLLNQVNQFSFEFQRLLIDLEVAAANAPTFFGIALPVDQWLANVRGSTPSLLVPANIVGVIRGVSENVAWVLITLVTTFYLLHDWYKLRAWLILQAPDDKRADFVRLFIEIKLVWQAYLRGQLVLMIVVGLVSGLGAAALGLEGAWFIGLLAGILDVIPSVGPAVAALVGIAVAWLTGSTYLPVPEVGFALIIGSWFLLVQTIENIWWRPRILGGSLRIHPALIFIGVVSALVLAGIFVTLIIVPLMGTIGVLWHYVRARMQGLAPWPDEPDSLTTLTALQLIEESIHGRNPQAATLTATKSTGRLPNG